jgi:hypothetical protein
MIYVIGAITGRQRSGVHPNPVTIINILVRINVIIAIDIRHIIIICMVITHGAPVGLASYVYAQAHMQLSFG